jgi:hypothetical protein
MKNIIAALFGFVGMHSFTAFGSGKAKSVDGVLLAFSKTIEDLKVVEEQERAEIAKQEVLERAAQAAKEAAKFEANRAKVAVERFSKLVGDI